METDSSFARFDVYQRVTNEIIKAIGAVTSTLETLLSSIKTMGRTFEAMHAVMKIQINYDL